MARTSFPLFSGMAAAAVIGLFVLVASQFGAGHLNPAITFGLWTVRKVTTLKAVVFIAAQMLGGVAAMYLLRYFLGHPMDSIAGKTFEWKLFTAEAVGAGIFAFGVAAAVLQKFETNKLAVTAALSVLAGVLVASLASNAVLNPAVAVGVQSWSKAYAIAPFAGSIVGMNIFSMFFADRTPMVIDRAPLAARSMAESAQTKATVTKKKTTVRKTTKKK